ncbi:unnamed protein product, partial [Laminaria digitata]
MPAAELHDFAHEDLAGNALHNALRDARERGPVQPAPFGGPPASLI